MSPCPVVPHWTEHGPRRAGIPVSAALSAGPYPITFGRKGLPTLVPTSGPAPSTPPEAADSLVPAASFQEGAIQTP